MLLEVEFQGGLADLHRLPAYDGTKSLEGVTRSILIITNYLVEGRVRRKDFGSVPLKFDLVAHRPGSFQTVYEIIYAAAAIGAPVGIGVTANLLTDLIKTVYWRVTGQPEADRVTEEIRRLEADRSGDIAALVEAVEPAVRNGHTVINNGVININVNSQAPIGENNLAQFTPRTKQYIWDKIINDDFRVRLFSVASFNANQGTGRAYDLEEGRSIPFELREEVDRTTVDTLLGSISSYTRRRRLGDDLRSAVAIKYTSIDAADGRIKKIRILAARSEIDDL